MVKVLALPLGLRVAMLQLRRPLCPLGVARVPSIIRFRSFNTSGVRSAKVSLSNTHTPTLSHTHTHHTPGSKVGLEATF